MHITAGIVLYCKILYNAVYIFHVVIHLIIKGRGILQPDPVKFMPLVLPTKAASQFAAIVSALMVFQGLLPAYSQSTCTGSEDNTN